MFSQFYVNITYRQCMLIGYTLNRQNFHSCGLCDYDLWVHHCVLKVTQSHVIVYNADDDNENMSKMLSDVAYVNQCVAAVIIVRCCCFIQLM